MDQWDNRKKTKMIDTCISLHDVKHTTSIKLDKQQLIASYVDAVRESKYWIQIMLNCGFLLLSAATKAVLLIHK